MNTVIINILCEGQTEERFVKEVMKPYFASSGIVLKHRLLVTSKKKNARGGMLNYAQAKGDLVRWMKENGERNSETHFYTTMFDFYALPDDFPGFVEAESNSDPYDKVEAIERALEADLNSRHFIPYIQLHEFEALCFCDISQMKAFYPSEGASIDALERVLEQYGGNPELINNSPNTAPSKRIIDAIEGRKRYRYNKPKSGADVTKNISMDKLMVMCRHFSNWVERLLACYTPSY